MKIVKFCSYSFKKVESVPSVNGGKMNILVKCKVELFKVQAAFSFSQPQMKHKTKCSLLLDTIFV